MGRIAKVLSFLRVTRNEAKVADVKLDPDGGSNITGVHFSAPGDGSQPLPNDYAVTVDIPGSGRQAVAGYADPINEPESGPGEVYRYGRDAGGVPINKMWLKADGTVILSNGNASVELSPAGSIKGLNGSGSFELQAGGDFVVNGAKITAAGGIESSGGAKLTAAGLVETALGRNLDTHVHTGVTIGPGNTGPPV